MLIVGGDGIVCRGIVIPGMEIGSILPTVIGLKVNVSWGMVKVPPGIVISGILNAGTVKLGNMIEMVSIAIGDISNDIGGMVNVTGFGIVTGLTVISGILGTLMVNSIVNGFIGIDGIGIDGICILIGFTDNGHENKHISGVTELVTMFGGLEFNPCVAADPEFSRDVVSAAIVLVATPATVSGAGVDTTVCAADVPVSAAAGDCATVSTPLVSAAAAVDVSATDADVVACATVSAATVAACVVGVVSTAGADVCTAGAEAAVCPTDAAACSGVAVVAPIVAAVVSAAGAAVSKADVEADDFSVVPSVIVELDAAGNASVDIWFAITEEMTVVIILFICGDVTSGLESVLDSAVIGRVTCSVSATWSSASFNSADVTCRQMTVKLFTNVTTIKTLPLLSSGAVHVSVTFAFGLLNV